MRNHYLTLGVMQDASERELVYAYRHLARKLHPDLHPNDPDAGARFTELQEAYDVLRDPAARRRHDAELGALGVVAPGTEPPGAVPLRTAWTVPRPTRPRRGYRPRAPRRAARRRRPWWAPPLAALLAFATASLVFIAVAGWDAYERDGAVAGILVLVVSLFSVLQSLVRDVVRQR